jgi:hypothetical protein
MASGVMGGATGQPPVSGHRGPHWAVWAVLGLVVLAGVGTGAYFLGRGSDSGATTQSSEVAAGAGTSLTLSGSSSTETTTTTGQAGTPTSSAQATVTTGTQATTPTTSKAAATTTSKAATTTTTKAAATTTTAALTIPGDLLTQPTLDLHLVDTWTRFENTDSRMEWLGDWEQTAFPSASGGSYALAFKEGWAVRIWFQGDGWRCVFVTGPENGIVHVWCDGIYCSKEGDYYAAAYGQSVFSSPSDGWTPGTHYVDIACSGQKNPSAGNILVMYDAFEVRNGTLIDAP